MADLKDDARALVERLRTQRVTHHQISNDWEPYATAQKVHPVEPIKLEAADMIERLLRDPPAGVAVVQPTENSEALVQVIASHIDGWRSATFGWQDDPDPAKAESNKQRAITAHAAECLRRIRAEFAAAGVMVVEAPPVPYRCIKPQCPNDCSMCNHAIPGDNAAGENHGS